MEPAVGFEPTTDGLQNRCSTTELSWPQQDANSTRRTFSYKQFQRPTSRKRLIGATTRLAISGWEFEVISRVPPLLKNHHEFVRRGLDNSSLEMQAAHVIKNESGGARRVLSISRADCGW